MKLLTKVAASGLFVLTVGGASIGATAAGIHIATRSSLASVTAGPPATQSSTRSASPSGQEAPDYCEATGSESDGHADGGRRPA
jgi:hypothetical protein